MRPDRETNTEADAAAYGLCLCGCGQPTGLAKQTDTRRGHTKGKPLPFLPCHHKVPDVDFEARFWTKVDRAAPGGCWVWTAGVTSAGYGSFWDRVAKHQAHRWIYERVVGPIPATLVLDHLCRNKRCVNPSHLEPVTNRENVLRGRAGIAIKEFWAGVTHCKRGHEYTPENTVPGPRRKCRTCRNARERAAWAARRGAVA